MTLAEWHLTSFPPDVITWCLFVLMLMLLVAPALNFLLHGWGVRHRDILGTFTQNAAESYLRTFHPIYLDPPATNPVPTTKPAPPANVSPKLATVPTIDFKSELQQYYTDLFGRRLFIFPLLLFFAIAATLLSLCSLTAIEWLNTSSFDHSLLPPQVVMAILGGYMWVVSDQIDISQRDNLLPASLYNGCFRLALAVPIAYAFSKLFMAELSIPISFLLGTFPTKTIASISREVVGSRWAKLDAKDPKIENPITKLRSIDSRAAERFADEDISTIFQLANCDPVRIAIRTGMSYGYILDCCGKALLWNYVGDQIAIFEDRGMIGVYEVRNLWLRLASSNPEEKTRAAHIVTELAAHLYLKEDEVLNLLTEIAKNPNTIFQHDTWMAGVINRQTNPAPIPN